MITVVLWIHVAAAFVGFVLSGVLAVIVLRTSDYRALSVRFWQGERVAQWVTVILAAAGAGLYVSGRRPTDILHLLYGALALLAVLFLAAFGPDRDPEELLQGWRVQPKWILFGCNVFLWAMYGRGLTTGLFGF